MMAKIRLRNLFSKYGFLLSPFALYFRVWKRKRLRSVLAIILLLAVIWIIFTRLIPENEFDEHADQDYNAVETSGDLTTSSLNASVLSAKLQESESKWQQSLNFLVPEEDDLIFQTHRFPKIDEPRSRFWAYFQPTFECPLQVERVGRPGDGGKKICGFSRMRHLKKCTVYSFGIENEVSFENMVLTHTHCTVRMYDPIPIQPKTAQLLTAFPNRVTYSRRKIGYYSRDSLKQLMAENGDLALDVLKIDVEGSEWPLMNKCMSDFGSQLPFGQILIEIHVVFNGREQYTYMRRLFHHLEIRGFRAFAREQNPRGPRFWEYSFLNVRLGMFPNEEPLQNRT